MERIFLINEAFPKEGEAALAPFGRCLRLPAFSKLPRPVASHPDMLILRLGDTLFIHKEYEAGQAILRENGVPFSLSSSSVEADYPRDVSLNAFSCGGFLFARRDALSPEAAREAERQGLTLVPVRQGYAKCSTVVAGDALATADLSIYRAAVRVGVQSLLLPKAHIGIEDYDTGFIGGASALLDDRTLCFFGDVTRYGGYEALKAFFAPRGIRLLSLFGGELFDYGGIVTVFCH